MAPLPSVMAPPPSLQPAFLETVEEIMRAFRTLPPRPTVEEVEAAVAVIRTADAEEQTRLEELSTAVRPPDVPDELFYVLQEVRRNAATLRGYEQRREASHVVDLDRRFRAFDDLIQRASRLVSGDGGGGDGRVEEAMRVGLGGDGSLVAVRKESDGKRGLDVLPRGLMRSSSLKSGLATSDGEPEKLSLIKVASLIEMSAKKGTGVLDLQGKLMDQIEWLPVSLGKLSDITELNLSENRVMALPSTIGSLKFLVKLDIHSNQLINLPDSIGELSSLIDLDLHANRLKSLPTSFGNLTSLANLDLSSNQLSHLPDTLGNLTSLRRLSVETNELEELPYTIGSCSCLVELRLDFNQLKALPEAIGKLESLEILTLHYNRVKSLPTTMASLSKLRELDASFNELELIPESLCFATGLVTLNVSNNFADLRSLPRSLGNLEMLEELNISNNQIRILPDSFRLLSKLRVLHADETPLELPPRQVVKLGAQEVVQYMADLLTRKELVPQDDEEKGFCFCLSSFCWPRTPRKN